MGKKRVVLKKVKKPCLKKDGVVARRASKGALKIEAQEVNKSSRSVPKPTRLNWVGSKKEKRNTDKNHRHKVALLPTTQEFAEVDDLRGDFYVDSEIREMRADSCNDRVTGDDGLIDGLLDF